MSYNEQAQYLKFAEKNYKVLLKYVKSQKWKFEENKEKYKINIDFEYEGSKIYTALCLNVDLGFVYVLARADDFEIPETRQSLVAAAVTLANGKIKDGGFDYNCFKNRILFRLTTSYIDCVLDKSIYAYMVSTAYHTVKDYHRKFKAVCTTKFATVGQLKSLIYN